MSCFGVALALDGCQQLVVTYGTVPMRAAIAAAQRLPNNVLTTTNIRLLQYPQ
jgi:hypothetical protein